MRKAVLSLLFALTALVVSCSSGGGAEPVCQTGSSKACQCGCSAHFDNGTVGTGATAVLACQPNGQWDGVCDTGHACGPCGGVDSGAHDAGHDAGGAEAATEGGQDAASDVSLDVAGDVTVDAPGDGPLDAPADVVHDATDHDAAGDARAHDASRDVVSDRSGD